MAKKVVANPHANRDASSRHVRDADEAISLGSVDQPAGNPFLNISLLVETAVRAGADAIHPGYGYLSENAKFADAVREAGIIFIGPTSTAINTLGDKREAKDYLAEHEPSIPLIPGFTGSSQGIQLADLERESAKIGFPVMIKASAGGGGRGLRIVRDASALASEFERAQSEAQRSFGLADCILEKYIEAGKHVEVQILGDSHGRVVSLWERDCSVQRRHQKVVEESPCAWLSQEKREAMCAAAVRIGELLRYEGAGTVEFILDLTTGSFYFLEVNARLQVEHPITEECTGLDLVSLQLFVASGGSLASLPRMSKITQNGHAIECRLCAEDPVREFAPQHGTVRFWKPSTLYQNDVRFETAMESGARVSIYFDSMIAKVVVWAPTRSMAIDKMTRIMADTVCLGVPTNQLFLQACLMHPGFHRVDYTTSFIPTNLDALLQNPYAAALRLPQALLSVVPSMFARHLRNRVEGGRTVFGRVRRGFRNQRFDRINKPSDIVSRYDAKKGSSVDPQICIWERLQSQVSQEATALVAPLPVVKQEEAAADSKESGTALVTKSYNALSTAIRNGALANSAVAELAVHQTQSRSLGQDTASSWYVGRVDVSINKRKVVAYVATGDGLSAGREADTGDSVQLYCHFPALGSPLEYHCFSILSYFESQRAAIEGNAQADPGVINAPMPCKVLQVLKKEGDEVKKGEIVMVIESMKMEITIAAGKNGKFHSDLKEGVAVNEGSQLCTFT